MDTSTSAITVAVHDGGEMRAERSVLDPRAHTEHLAPLVAAVLAEAAVTPGEVTDVAVGVGPGPFTGLRVGIMTARTFAFARGIPCHAVVSLDALAHAAVRDEHVPASGGFAVATDARRKEVYFARYAAADGRAQRLSGPIVIRPGDLPAEDRELPTVGRGPVLYPEHFAHAAQPLDVGAGALAEVALTQLADGTVVGLDALYLRRPDAQPSAVATAAAASAAAARAGATS
ncbi:MAG: tRNA (adenosine(37)-N6)-threonylcarbamoyltransferase complex dimerization subunit type 1 TsaB [Actinomycetia bacterium]|nr:tRNA (adenosine(37)-N6)-threonylcarbamoyltransferase complex dimerization subunit type 1 TsaB [Actinomycetes bacterium]